MTESLAQELVTRLKGAGRVLLVVHRRPDADSLGSAAATAALLDTYQIPYSFYCSTPLPAEASYFGIDERNTAAGLRLEGAQGLVLCTFDAGDLVHAGIADFITPPAPPRTSDALRGRSPTEVSDLKGGKGALPFLINIDHHATNTRFGHLNIVETGCASTTEVVYRLFHLLRVPIAARTAGHLLAGLLHDTDHFFNPATSGPALQMASRLMEYGVTLQAMRQLLFERWSMGSLRMIGEVLARLKLNDRYGIAVTYVTDEDAARHQVSLEEVEGIANVLNVLGEVKAMCVLKSSEGRICGSFRTTRDEINVGRLAELLGGGGHRKAAGFTIKGTLSRTPQGIKIR